MERKGSELKTKMGEGDEEKRKRKKGIRDNERKENKGRRECGRKQNGEKAKEEGEKR